MDDKSNKFRQQFREDIIPSFYSGQLHVLFNFSTLLFAFLFPLTQLTNLTSFFLVLIIILILGNLVVFLIHKFILHQTHPLFKFAYKIHTIYHHQFFTDKNLVYDGPKDFYILFFPTWVVMGHIILMYGLIYQTPLFNNAPDIAHLTFSFSNLYFLLYEILHYISHLPENSPLLKFPFFRIMRKHHLNHHNPKLMNSKNFNIVFPLFDFLFGTFYKAKK